MSQFWTLKGEDQDKFLQSKYEYYRNFNLWTIVIASVTSVMYFISDCQLFGHFAWDSTS
jgi:hypothetical protein